MNPFRLTGWLIAGFVAFVRDHPYKAAGGGVGVIAALIVWGLASTLQTLPVNSVQLGYRGTGMYEQYNVHKVDQESARNTPTGEYPPVKVAGQPAVDVFKNIQVLKTVDSNDFLRLMASMAQWVAPQVGCAYCHSVANMASDVIYTKEIARHMLLMTQYINENWRSHVGAAGVTCATCHRGQGAPQFTWTFQLPPGGLHGFAATTTGEDMPSAAADLSALPSDPYTPFLLHADPIDVQGTTALPNGNRTSVEQTNWTYALMMNFAHSLGVGCNFCHNSRAFSIWDQGTPNRVTAWYGIQMVRDLNNNFMVPITNLVPASRRGPMGDVPKIYCETCHQGAYAPFYGAHVVDTYPSLTHPTNGTGQTAQGAVQPPPFALPVLAKTASIVQSSPVAQSGGATP